VQQMGQVFAAIAVFKDRHPEWSTQEGALFKCVDASYEFIAFLNDFGLKAKTFEFGVDEPNRNPDPMIFKSGANESGRIRSWGHCIVELGELLIDWTARQYVATAPFPYIIPKSCAMSAKAGA
jgi:hypothetical protein